MLMYPYCYYNHPYRRWSVNLNLRENDVGYTTLHKKSPPVDMTLVQSVEKDTYSIKDDTGITAAENKQAMAIRSRKQSKAMSIAMSPGKQIASKFICVHLLYEFIYVTHHNILMNLNLNIGK